MTLLFVYTLAAFGLAYIVGHSTISLPLRKYLGGSSAEFIVEGVEVKGSKPPVPGALGPIGDLLCALMECPACFGFWIGAVVAVTIRDVGIDGTSFLSSPFVLGCYTSGTNFVLARLTRLS